jgi:hypothetical protein
MTQDEILQVAADCFWRWLAKGSLGHPILFTDYQRRPQERAWLLIYVGGRVETPHEYPTLEQMRKVFRIQERQLLPQERQWIEERLKVGRLDPVGTRVNGNRIRGFLYRHAEKGWEWSVSVSKIGH